MDFNDNTEICTENKIVTDLLKNKSENSAKKICSGRLPDYLKRPIIDTDKTRNVRKILKANNLNTVCENARCPNKNECYQKYGYISYYG